ncbi:Zinc finger protein [Armadillidium vulgare]|nr:Zinc finger protein [Armadillidium vulgare]
MIIWITNEDLVIKEECFEDDEACDDYLKENNEDTAWGENCWEQKIKTGFLLHETSIKIENESQPLLLGVTERSILSEVFNEEVVPEFILPKLHEEDVLNKTISSSYTNKNANKLKCADCEYQTNFISYLKEHRVTHSDERPFKCSHCKFASKLKSNLKKHERTHNLKKKDIKT